ncbi:toxin-antitoxin system, toxin component, HicA family [Desulfitobacterium hafniense DP7]|uniref:HicA toxin of toxin-antitoxin n=2 Tax=Desulfitobacterium TaxID=36853 RepID=A0A1M7UE59_9FIRM|nr:MULTISPECIES: type II toxin-antitoxin system HicA family toxin [Desulfitobacterium]EHL08220.1 toxin-antitoxin system, toxin component, HicA family [Desulfitobacterium hafniense DP7]SHN81226.1 HicA toxin of toxin-antitoxin [Desulfitobacterium chlororespirans DSM 11544]
MKTSELLKLLAQNNITLKRHGKKHDIYYSPITNKSFPVPRHKTEIAKGTLDSILNDAGLK